MVVGVLRHKIRFKLGIEEVALFSCFSFGHLIVQTVEFYLEKLKWKKMEHPFIPIPPTSKRTGWRIKWFVNH
jgi:hypothetical protein